MNKKIPILEYTRTEISKSWLKSNGFYRSAIFSDEETDVYVYRFPVYKYKHITMLECELKVILGENIVYVDVYKYNTLDRYEPFYNVEYGKYDAILFKIQEKINKKFSKLKISKELVLRDINKIL